MTFSSYIKHKRHELDLTQAGLATLLDVDKQSISNWECGRSVPWPKEQGRIVACLDRPAPRERVIDRILKDDD